MANDDTLTYYPDGKENYYLPAKSICIPVDKQKVLDNGVVRQEDSDKIVDQIEITLPENYMYKSNMMVLDLLAHYDWERPVYFAVSIGDDNFMHLHEYLQLEGLALRLVPIKSDVPASEMIQKRETGRIDTEIMYHNLMEKFHFGGMNKPDVYLDGVNRGMLTTLKNSFIRLAEKLVMEEKKEKAIAVLDRADIEFPIEKTGYTIFDLNRVKIYYLIKENDRALKVLSEMEKQLNAEQKYYSLFDLEYKNVIENRVKGNQQLLNWCKGFRALFVEYAPEMYKPESTPDYKQLAKDAHKEIVYYNQLPYAKQSEINQQLDLILTFTGLFNEFTEEHKRIFSIDEGQTVNDWFMNVPEDKLQAFTGFMMQQTENEKDQKRFSKLTEMVLKARKDEQGYEHIKWLFTLDSYQLHLLVEYVRININL